MNDEQRSVLCEELGNYTRYREQIRECAYDIYYSGLTQDYSRIRSGRGGYGNGVEDRVINNLSENERKALWIRVFEFTCIKYKDEQKDELLKLKYIKRVARREICQLLHVSSRTYDYWLAEVLETAFMWAKYFKLL